MHTDTQEGIPLPPFRGSCPNDFLAKRRKFKRKDENTPYIDFVRLSFLDDECDEEEDSEDDEEDESTDPAGKIDDANILEDNSGSDQNDKEMQELDALSPTRLFMKGMIGDEDALEYPDQVDTVAGFAEQPRIREFEKCGAILEDRGAVGGTNGQKVYSRPYFGPLTPHQLHEELSKKRFSIESDEDGLTNLFDGDGSDAEIRQVFITDLNPSSIEAITANAPRSHAAALRNLFYRYLTGKSSIGVTISTLGFRVYTLEFNIPYFVLKKSLVCLKDPRKQFDGTPLRESLDLPFLSGGHTGSTSSKGNYRLHQAQMSVAVTGFDQWVWTAYGFFETYFGSKESVLGYDKLKGRMGRADPFAAGQIPAHSLISTPREWFFKVLEIRINQVRREWRMIVTKIESEMKLSRTEHVFPLLSNDANARKEARDSSLWSSQMIGLLRLLIGGLSDIINSWEEFCRRDMGYFQYDGDVPNQSTLLHSSVSAVDKAFSDLRCLRRILEDLKNELCENNPQGLNAHLGFGNHEAAIFQQRTARDIQVLTVITILFFPLVLAMGMFSTQGALPFTPNPARFAYSFIVLALLVTVALVVLYKWNVWFQPHIEYVVQESKARIAAPHQKKRQDKDASSTVSDVWPAFQSRSSRAADLERGPVSGGVIS